MLNESLKSRVVSGAAIGAANGLFGGGGGMVAVPLLENALGYGEKQAHATAILVIAPICAVSALLYFIAGYAELKVIIPAAIGNSAGGLVGALFLGKLPSFWVNIVFIAVMLAAGIRMAVA